MEFIMPGEESKASEVGQIGCGSLQVVVDPTYVLHCGVLNQ